MILNSETSCMNDLVSMERTKDGVWAWGDGSTEDLNSTPRTHINMLGIVV